MFRARTSRVIYARSPDLEGLEAAYFEGFVGSRVYYARREYVFGLADGNSHREFDYRGEEVRVGPDQVVVVQAGKPYSVTVPKPVNVFWVMVDVALLRRFCGLDEGRVARMPYFPELHLEDPQLARCVAKLHRLVMAHAPLPEREKTVQELLTRALENHTSPRPQGRRGTRKMEMAKIRDHMQDSLDRNVPLTELAEMTGMSVFQFVRTFAREMGLTPHALLIHMRAQKARELLKKGASATTASEEAGFSDPSHLVRHFKRIFKITPGQYAAAGEKRLSEADLASIKVLR